MAKKIRQIILTVRVDIEIDKKIDIEDIINELEYNFKDTTGKAEIVNTEICGFEESNCN